MGQFHARLFAVAVRCGEGVVENCGRRRLLQPRRCRARGVVPAQRVLLVERERPIPSSAAFAAVYEPLAALAAINGYCNSATRPQFSIATPQRRPNMRKPQLRATNAKIELNSAIRNLS